MARSTRRVGVPEAAGRTYSLCVNLAGLSTVSTIAPKTGQIFLYFSALTLIVYLVSPQGYLVDISTSYMLKNQLHAAANQIAMYRLATALPAYSGIVFGLARDKWNPLGLRDRGLLLIFAPLTAAVFISMASTHLSYSGLLAGMLVAMASFQFSQAAYQGLITLIGQEDLMTGRLSTLWNIFSFIPYVAGAFASGYISEHLLPRQTFLLVAELAVVLACLGLLKPRSVFGHAYDQPQAKGTDFVGDIKRLVKHKAVYPAILINFLSSFMPGASTPLQFYLTNRLGASDATYSYFTGIFLLSFIPMFLLYGFLCKRVALNKLLWWGTFIMMPQMIPLAFVHSARLALLMAVPMGLMGGIATVVYIDLAMRSCPAGLQGTLMGLVSGVLTLSLRGSDVVGAWIYNSSPTHGFLYCVIATTAVYALILPLLPLVPKELSATADGEANPRQDF
jgi:MFS family permease